MSATRTDPCHTHAPYSWSYSYCHLPLTLWFLSPALQGIFTVIQHIANHVLKVVINMYAVRDDSNADFISYFGQ